MSYNLLGKNFAGVHPQVKEIKESKGSKRITMSYRKKLSYPWGAFTRSLYAPLRGAFTRVPLRAFTRLYAETLRALTHLYAAPGSRVNKHKFEN